MKGLCPPSLGGGQRLVQMEAELSCYCFVSPAHQMKERSEVGGYRQRGAAMQISLSRVILDCFEFVTSRPESRIKGIALSPHRTHGSCHPSVSALNCLPPLQQCFKIFCALDKRLAVGCVIRCHGCLCRRGRAHTT